MASPMSIHIAVPADEAGHANAAIMRAMAWLEALSDRLTRFSSESELSHLNASAGTWCAVSGTLFTVVAESVSAAQATNGLFDPALLPLLEAIGYDRDYNEIQYRESGQPGDILFTAGRWREIELDAQRLRIRLPEGARLDLGGIAKGWAADAALRRYFRQYENVLINAGGDMRIQGGKTPDEPWPIAIGNPLASPGDKSTEDAAVLTMRSGGIATSGASERWWLRGGERQHHLLDPRTGRSIPVWVNAAASDDQSNQGEASQMIATATALAPTAAHAEVAAKAALLRGYPEALRYVEDAWDADHAVDAPPYGDAGVALLLILGNGTIVGSANVHEFLGYVGGGGDLWLD